MNKEELKYTKDISEKINAINERSIRATADIQALLLWKRDKEALDSHNLRHLEDKTDKIGEKLGMKINKLQQEVNDVQVESIKLMNAIREENHSAFNKLTDKIQSNSLKIAWICGGAFTAQTILTFIFKVTS